MRENLRKTQTVESFALDAALAASANGTDVDHSPGGSILHETTVVIPAGITAANYWEFKIQSSPDDGTGSPAGYVDSDADHVLNDANDVTSAGMIRKLVAGDSSSTIFVRGAYVGPDRFSRLVATKFAAAPNIGVCATALRGHLRHQGA